jgi:hypothetical protein
MSHIRNNKRWAALVACVSLGVLAGPVLPASGAAATGRSALAPFPASKVDFIGFGDGPGLGMGQWGAFGYATLEHKTYQWILGHYYGGTTLWSGTSVVSNDPMVSVDINANDGHPVVVTSGSAFTFGGHPFLPGQAARAVLSAGEWSLEQAPGCSSTTWSPVASQLVNPVAVPSSLQPSASSSQVLTICEQGGAQLPVRGTVQAFDAPHGAVTLNILPLEEYVRGVVSAEVTWSWGLFGGTKGSPQKQAWGFQALEAQAVATRSYVAAEIASGGWQPYATTCDAYCQSYPGMADETPVMDAAVTDTAGEILEQPGQTPPTPVPVQPPGPPGQPGVSHLGAPGGRSTQPGTPVYAEYGASTGGYTGGGPFPGVVDLGDVVCIKSSYYTCNPCHRWSAAVPVSALEKAFKSIGQLAAVDILQRNGHGALGGRVGSVEIVGTTGVTLTIPAWELGPFLANHNPRHCASDWYGVTNGP